MQKIYLGLGGNIGKKEENFKLAHIQIKTEIGEIIRSSSLYETPPWGFESKDNFWNQVVLVQTFLKPKEILGKIKFIEQGFGRIQKSEGYASRPMDIDILYYNDAFMKEKALVIPHPLLQDRKFVLAPLVEIAPDFVHPLLRQTNFQLLENCRDNSAIKKLDIDL